MAWVKWQIARCILHLAGAADRHCTMTGRICQPVGKLLHLLRIKRAHISLIYDPLRDRIDRLAAFRHDAMKTILILVHKGLPEHPRCTLEQRKCIQSIYSEMREYRRMCAASMENEFLVNETCQR